MGTDRRAGRIACAGLLLAISPVLAAQDGPWRSANVLAGEGRNPLSGQVEALAWLAGRWVGEGLGGTAEYLYSPPAAGTIMGTFRHARDDAVTFYEIIVIGEFGGRTAIRFKHFDAELRGWEARTAWLEFPLLALEPGAAAYFDGLTYRLDEDGGLEAYVISESDHGTERELAFRFRRAVDSGAPTSPEEVLGN